MPLVRKSLILPYDAEDLFALVCDVRSYPEFVGWVKALDIIHQHDDGHIWRARAKTKVAFAGLIQCFSTDVEADRSRLTIEVRLIEGPFNRLRNSWRFFQGADGARTDFLIDFQFKNGLLRVLSAIHADHAGQILANKFTEEAERRYGVNTRKALATG